MKQVSRLFIIKRVLSLWAPNILPAVQIAAFGILLYFFLNFGASAQQIISCAKALGLIMAVTLLADLINAIEFVRWRWGEG